MKTIASDDSRAALVEAGARAVLTWEGWACPESHVPLSARESARLRAEAVLLAAGCITDVAPTDTKPEENQP